MSIKICFIASHFPQGGAERQVLELIKGLQDKDYDITLMLYQSNEIFFNELKSLNINFILNSKEPSRVKIKKRTV